MNQLNVTAATLRAMLCYVRSGKTPTIAYDNDAFAELLANKLEEAVGDRAGSEPVSIFFSSDERELFRQFQGCASGISGIFSTLARGFVE
jgi:hypothetical protein